MSRLSEIQERAKTGLLSTGDIPFLIAEIDRLTSGHSKDCARKHGWDCDCDASEVTKLEAEIDRLKAALESVSLVLAFVSDKLGAAFEYPQSPLSLSAISKIKERVDQAHKELRAPL